MGDSKVIYCSVETRTGPTHSNWIMNPELFSEVQANYIRNVITDFTDECISC